ncbi:leukotriene A-4 hydrolase-like isoform X2 [Oppia nitens]|nr:leukotriene A-4 hydrolase-like isoform X2 [Oppia nitens]XP_054153155.1 leukotriene A-4 hydrolase-like isoform X2 [Oppia nitens]
MSVNTTEALMEELNNNPIDANSFARPDLSRVSHISWKAFINFDDQIIEATVDLTVDKQNETIDELFLDTTQLSIFDVRNGETNEQLSYELSPSVAVFGSKLTVKLPPKKRSIIRIDYRTSNKASALQWLKPEQTAGKRQPYLFSQCQAIYCRSIIPCQDTPAVKTPYDATVVVPKDVVVLMSAMRVESGSWHQSDKGMTKEYRFEQKIAIPSYLMAIVAGDLVSKRIGPRSHVWSEPEVIDQCAYEFANTEKFITTAENIVGPYVWGIYDLLVLPPSFPFGGMENPCLTFVTPTLLAGDRSLDVVVAHEIAHSWTGNLVTNKNWGNFWLNEGFTRFLEMKIVGRLNGGEPNRQFNAIGGLKALKFEIEAMGEQNNYTKLMIDPRGVDPEDAFSSVPYEKGHTFLFYLEQLLGGPQVFEPFLKSYINHFKYQSIETNDFKEYLENYFKDKTDILSKVEWDLWLHSTGMPPIIPDYDKSLSKMCTELTNKWINANDNNLSEFKLSDISSMNPMQVKEFLSQLLDSEIPLSLTKMHVLTEIYGLKSNKNSEIRSIWIRLGLKSHWKECINETIEFITSQGRMKFVKPIYRALYAWDETKQLAVNTFNANKNQMMSISLNSVAKELNIKL